MKEVLFLGLFLIGCSTAFSQNFFFVDKKGKKTIIKDDSFDLIIRDKRLEYIEYGKEWEKYIKFKDLDYALIGSYYFKTFELVNVKGNKEKPMSYFVMAQTPERKLLCYTYTVIGKYSSTDHYDIYVVDNNDTVLDYVKLNTTGIYTNARAKIAPFMKKHFEGCKPVIDEFLKYDDSDEKHLNVLRFFDQPYYRTCD